MIDNPLLDFSGLPRFADILPEHVTPAVDKLISAAQSVLDGVTRDDTPSTWDAVVAPFDSVKERLGRVWSQISHLNAVMNSPEMREAYNLNLPRLTIFYASFAQNSRLFEKYRSLSKGPDFVLLDRVRQRVVERSLRDFRLGGAELSEKDKGRFLAIQEELSTLGARFEENLLDATDSYEYLISDQEVLSGLPQDYIDQSAQLARQKGKDGFLLTLQAPVVMAVLQYADRRELREQIYRAWSTRASDLGEARLDNSGIMTRIIQLRNQEAKLLGFKSYADLSLATKMAASPKSVTDFLNDLAVHARAYAEHDLADLTKFAQTKLNISDMQAWDVSYVSEKLRNDRFNFSEDQVREYFPLDRVIKGLFRVTETLYGLHIVESATSVWHPDVRFFEITSSDGSLVGSFYTDLFARSMKRGGAWMDEVIGRHRKNGIVEAPVALLTCNFSPPLGNRPALLTHDDVITLFHEFGHGLHHLLTEVDELELSGIRGVEWDAVELPSQFMENFCWEWQVLSGMTRHVTSSASLPRSLFDQMLASRYFQSGLQLLRQIEYSLFDMRLHNGQDIGNAGDIMRLLDEVRIQVAVLVPPAFNRFAHGFSHIFAGGYAAGYYSYKWAEVLSADVYELFEEQGVLNPEIGARFREEILSRGGSRDAMESFVAFRGRQPRIDALLRYSGMGPLT